MSGGRTVREIVHDLNNLFAALSGFAEILRDDLPPDTMQRLMAEKILRGQLQVESLVHDLVTVIPDCAGMTT